MSFELPLEYVPDDSASPTPKKEYIAHELPSYEVNTEKQEQDKESFKPRFLNYIAKPK